MRKKDFAEGEAQGTTVITKRDAHIEELVNRSADAIDKTSKCDRISGIGRIPDGYVMHPMTIARPLWGVSTSMDEDLCGCIKGEISH